MLVNYISRYFLFIKYLGYFYFLVFGNVAKDSENGYFKSQPSPLRFQNIQYLSIYYLGTEETAMFAQFYLE